MSIQMLTAWNGLEQWQVYTLSAAAEERLKGLGLARAWTDATEPRNPLAVGQDPATGSFVVPGRGEVLRTDDSPGADMLRRQGEHFSSTAAISTTATIRITPTGVYRMARVAWLNNGGSPSGVLYVASNCGNDVEGLVASQSAKQREAQLAIGGALQIVSPVPITSLNFSSDSAYTAAAHQLLVSFGE